MDIYWLWLSQIYGVGQITLRKLIQIFGTPLAVYEAERRELEASGLRNKIIEEILEKRSLDEVKREEEKMRNQGVKLLPFTDPLYPQKINDMPALPALLFYRGELINSAQSIGIVGSRRCTEYGKRVALEAAAALAREGITVASGFAKGIDSYAHTACIKAGGKTLAFLANGLDICYPPEQRSLMEEIALNGAIISPYPLGTRPRQGFFPLRNKLLGAWVDPLLVVEAAERSGALITAEYSLEVKRRVLAVPNSIYSHESAGTNQLLRRGAEVYLEPAQLFANQAENSLKDTSRLLEDQDSPRTSYLNHEDAPSREEQEILDQLISPKRINELLNLFNGNYSELITLLCIMELDGKVTLSGEWVKRSAPSSRIFEDAMTFNLPSDSQVRIPEDIILLDTYRKKDSSSKLKEYLHFYECVFIDSHHRSYGDYKIHSIPIYVINAVIMERRNHPLLIALEFPKDFFNREEAEEWLDHYVVALIDKGMSYVDNASEIIDQVTFKGTPLVIYAKGNQRVSLPSNMMEVTNDFPSRQVYKHPGG